MNYSEIKYCDIANGIGARTSLFVSGCRHHCKGCFNEVAWDFSHGKAFTDSVEDDIIKSLKPDYIMGLSILGGEPLEPENQPHLLKLLGRVTDEYPDKSVWLWTGFTFEELVDAVKAAHDGRTDCACRASTPILWDLLWHIDVLVDGRYIDDQRDITLRFRGSPNQRILDMNRSLDELLPIPWSDGPILGTRKWMSDVSRLPKEEV